MTTPRGLEFARGTESAAAPSTTLRVVRPPPFHGGGTPTDGAAASRGIASLLLPLVKRTLAASRFAAETRKLPPVPVDPVPLARVAGPIPHFRKLAFVFGATATLLALVLIHQLTGIAP